MTRLCAVILTLNEAAHIGACIESVRFADDVLVFDSFSTDETVSLARNAGAQVIQHRFEDYTRQRNAALNAAGDLGADWVLFVDADERVTPDLAAEIRRALTTDCDADGAPYAGWRIPRHNYIFGKLTRGAGWYPDYQTRLLRLGRAHYDPSRQVHETVLLEGALGTLEHPLVHYNYRDLSHFIDKQQRYTAYEARVLHRQGVKPRPHNYILQPLRHFRWRFFTLRGYRDGWHGLRLSVIMAWYEWRKYRILGEMWRARR